MRCPRCHKSSLIVYYSETNCILCGYSSGDNGPSVQAPIDLEPLINRSKHGKHKQRGRPPVVAYND